MPITKHRAELPHINPKRMTKKKPRETKTQKTIKTLRRIWGNGIPNFPGSVYEGEEIDDAEIVLHELAHQTLLPKSFIFSPMKMISAHRSVGDYLDTLPKWRRDIHEIKAIAIELVAARLLGLRLNRIDLIRNSAQNTALYDNAHGHTYKPLVLKAMKTWSVIQRANIICALIDQYKKKQ